MPVRKRPVATFGLRRFPEARLQYQRYRRNRQVLREGRREVRSREQDYRNSLRSVLYLKETKITPSLVYF